MKTQQPRTHSTLLCFFIQAELERLRRQHQLTCRRSEELERDNAMLRGQLAEVQKASADLQSGLEDQRAHLDDQKAQLARLRCVGGRGVGGEGPLRCTAWS